MAYENLQLGLTALGNEIILVNPKTTNRRVVTNEALQAVHQKMNQERENSKGNHYALFYPSGEEGKKDYLVSTRLTEGQWREVKDLINSFDGSE